jgi:nitroreductase
MDIYEAIEKRRTIRKFKAPATEQQLKRILIAGTKAPSGTNKQQWEFVVVKDPALIEKISERKYVLNRGNKPRGEEVPPEQEKIGQLQKETFANASIILVYTKKGAAADGWLCIENMSLAAVAEGLGAKISGFSMMGADKDINKLVQAPEDYELTAALHIGVPAETPKPRSLRPEGSWLHENKF